MAMVSLRRVARIVLAVAVVSLVVIGSLPAVQASSIGVPVVPRSTGTLDERFAQIAMLVPAFGGMYYAGDTLVVYLTNLAARPAALQAIGAVFGPAVLTSGGVEVRLATYGFLQLMQWHARMRSLFALPGVVMLDIDEMANRLKVGVAEAPISGTTSTASFRAVEVALTQLGVPRTAVTIVPMQPFATSATLRDNTRPIEGGIQIAFSMFLCTLGFNGVRSGVAGFVVNSHCTDDRVDRGSGHRYVRGRPRPRVPQCGSVPGRRQRGRRRRGQRICGLRDHVRQRRPAARHPVGRELGRDLVRVQPDREHRASRRTRADFDLRRRLRLLNTPTRSACRGPASAQGRKGGPSELSSSSTHSKDPGVRSSERTAITRARWPCRHKNASRGW